MSRSAREVSSCGVRLLVAALAAGAVCTTANAAVTLLGVQYQEDNPYSEYLCYWHSSGYPTSCGGDLVGCNVHAYLKNDGGASVTVDDVTVAGYSLNTILEENVGVHDAYSIFFHWDNPPQAIFDAGEPVWYKAVPNPIPAGGVAEVVVRLRWVPQTQPVSLGIVTSDGTINTTVPVDANAPQLASVGFSSDRKKVYLHWRRSGGAGPTTIKMDGTDVTADATTVSDSSVNFAATVLARPTALSNMSYHVYQGIYSDGKTATAALRTWVNPFVHGTWAARDGEGDDYEAAEDWVDETVEHGVNALIHNTSNLMSGFTATSAGRQYCDNAGYGFVIKDYNDWSITTPLMWFLDDETDIEESNLWCGAGKQLPCGRITTGVLGMRSIKRAEELQDQYMAPTTINIDGTQKPNNWYSYGQLVDVLMVDSYYQMRVRDYCWYNPQLEPLFEQAKVIYATALAATTAAEPNPFHILLYSCESRPAGQDVWRFPFPQTKRIEAYYALAGGATGMAYWWYKAGYPSNGLDDGGPEASALWKEIGLVGNEIKTAQPLLVKAHPVDMTVVGSTDVWVRPLASRTDTIILLVVNDNYYVDEYACHYTPVSNATVTATLPSWMQSSPTAFEISASGLSDVSTQLNGNQLQLNLGTLNLTRMIVVTTDAQLRATIQQRYEQEVWPGVCAFAPEHCLPQNNPPSITQQPSNQEVFESGSANFTIFAGGSSPLSHQWQKNQVNLSDGGHYSGCTTATLTVSSVNSSDAASYRCVVTNPYGTATSNEATLTLAAPGPPTITQQPSNESVTPGSMATFTVSASGTAPLSYRWQKNQTNLSNGGHYSGCTTVTLTVSSADGSDEANYRCVVTNSYGSATSNEAALTVVSCTPGILLNGSFEGGNTNGVADNWTGYQRAPNPTTVWSIQTASPPTGGGLQYQQIANTSASGGGGVRQDVTGCTIGYTYTISGWMRTNSISWATCAVKCSPTASTSWSTAIDLNPPQTTMSNSWVSFSGTVTATGTSMTIWLDGHTSGTGLNKAACFDAVTVTGCTAPAPPTITQQPSARNVCAGGTAAFSITATGDGTLTYRWQKNQANLSNGGHYSGATTATLTITGADSGDAANYRCVVTNEGGSTNSNAAALTLKAATTITQQPSDQSVNEGETAIFSVTATGDGTRTYRWQKNQVNLSNGGHYSGVTTATLTVSSADTSDTANYRCVVTAGCGSVTSSQAVLTISGSAAVPGDFDGDGDADLEDFGHFQVCLTGPATPQEDPECQDVKFDGDSDVDQEDFAVFLGCMSSANVAVDPTCAD